MGYLPELRFQGIVDPVVLVYQEESMELHYGIRVSGDVFLPPVYEEGRYTIRVIGDGSGPSERSSRVTAR